MYQDFINENIAPRIATKIGVYNSNSEKVGKIELGNLNRITGEKLYSFGLLSDVHNRSSQGDENNADIQRALTYFNQNEEVLFTCICGDISYNGTASEFQQYKNNVDTYSPNTPVYTCVGNHDATTSGLNESNWQIYTGHNRCFEITQGEEHFIFFGMNKWSFGTSGTPFLQTDIDWLESKLEEYRNQRTFVFLHPFFPSRCGNYRNLYNNSAWLQGSQLTKLEELCDHYKNTVWFSGHSHWKWYLQKYQENANIYRNNSGWCVHVPSCAYPRDDSNNGVGTMQEKPLESEGAVVDVYSNFIVIRGRDFKNAKFLPIAIYKLDTSLVNIEAEITTKPCTSISLNTNTLNFTDESTQTLIATPLPSDTTDSVSWSVEPSGVVSVVNGVVTPIATGNATITATCGSKSASCNVNVNLPSPYIYGFHHGRKIDSSTGVETDGNNDYTCSDFIEIDNTKAIYADGSGITDSGARKSVGKFAFYDENKNYLTYTGNNSNYQLGWSGTTFKDTTSNFNPPATTKYIKIRLYCTYGQVSASDFIANTRIVEDGVELGSDRVSE